MNNQQILNRSWKEIKDILPELIAEYESEIDACADRIRIGGKTADQALRDQAQWPGYYGMKKAEIRKLVKLLDAQVKSIRSQQYKQLTEAHQRNLSTTDKEHYVDSHPEYLKFYELFLEIEELYEKFIVIGEAFTTRSFSLRDWTQLRIHNFHNDII